jgi:hypothetical protein
VPAVSGTRRPTESIPGHVSGDWWGGLTHRAPARSPRRYGCSPHPCEHGVARLGWGFRPPITAPSLSPAPRTSGWCRAAVTADRHPALRATPRACAVKARPHRAYPVVGSRRGYRPPPHEPYRNPSCPSCACACASAAASRVGPRFPRACSVSRLRGRRAPSRRVRHVRYQAERVPTWCGPSGTRSNEERPWLLGWRWWVLRSNPFTRQRSTPSPPRSRAREGCSVRVVPVGSGLFTKHQALRVPPRSACCCGVLQCHRHTTPRVTTPPPASARRLSLRLLSKSTFERGKRRYECGAGRGGASRLLQGVRARRSPAVWIRCVPAVQRPSRDACVARAFTSPGSGRAARCRTNLT